MSEDKYFILSIDGGGVRGVIPAIVLDFIQSKLNKPLIQTVNMLAGTSTGGIICCLLASKYNTQAIKDIYLGCTLKELFKPVLIPHITNGYKYKSNAIESVLAHFMPSQIIRECPVDLLITAYNTSNSTATFFTKQERIGTDLVLSKYKDFYLKDIARATSAAPTFFEPHNLQGGSYIDGGVACNFPAAIAFANALNMYPNKEIVIISLGTGSLNLAKPWKHVHNLNPLDWLLKANLTGLFMDGGTDTADAALKEVLRPNTYYRFQCKLPEELSSMDNITSKNIEKLRDLATSNIETIWKQDLDNIIELLYNR